MFKEACSPFETTALSSSTNMCLQFGDLGLHNVQEIQGRVVDKSPTSSSSKNTNGVRRPVIEARKSLLPTQKIGSSGVPFSSCDSLEATKTDCWRFTGASPEFIRWKSSCIEDLTFVMRLTAKRTPFSLSLARILSSILSSICSQSLDIEH